MKLHGQRGYAMVTLLVGLSIASLLMTATMPVWSQLAKREREEELLFRLGQYSRAIRLFQSRNGPGVVPPSVDVLVQQKHLRKKFKDPITGEDFAPVTALTQTTITPGGAGRGGGPPLSAPAPTPATNPVGRGGAQQPGGAVAGGLRGVVSTSEAESLRTLNGKTHYNEWLSTDVPNSTLRIAAANAPGRSGVNQAPGGFGRGAPAGPGGRGGGASGGGFNPGRSGPGPQPQPGPGGRR